VTGDDLEGLDNGYYNRSVEMTPPTSVFIQITSGDNREKKITEFFLGSDVASLDRKWWLDLRCFFRKTNDSTCEK
jgi:hypothetical protein